MNTKTKLFAVDVGNSVVKFGLLNEKKLLSLEKTDFINKESTLSSFLSFFHSNTKSKLDTFVVVVSSVTGVGEYLKKGVRKALLVDSLVVSKDLSLPLTIKYNTPNTLGFDRVVNAIGGAKLFGAPVVVVSHGTCLVFDLVSPSYEYMGGSIFPGVGMSLNSLSHKTSNLPPVLLNQKGVKELGDTTFDSINTGLVYGYNNLFVGEIKRYKEFMLKRYHVPCKAVLCGGDFEIFEKNLGVVDFVEENLSLFGLREVYKEHKASL